MYILIQFSVNFTDCLPQKLFSNFVVKASFSSKFSHFYEKVFFYFPLYKENITNYNLIHCEDMEHQCYVYRSVKRKSSNKNINFMNNFFILITSFFMNILHDSKMSRKILVQKFVMFLLSQVRFASWRRWIVHSMSHICYQK